MRSHQCLLGNGARCPYGAHSYPKPGKAVCGNGYEGHGATVPPSQPAKVSPVDRQASSGGESGLLPDSEMDTSLVTYFHSQANGSLNLLSTIRSWPAPKKWLMIIYFNHSCPLVSNMYQNNTSPFHLSNTFHLFPAFLYSMHISKQNE